MKYFFSIRRFTYAIDEHQKKHELRPYVRGTIGALAAGVSLLTVRTVDRRISFFICLIIIVAIYLAVVFIANYIVFLLAKHGCEKLFETNPEDDRG